MTLDERKSKPAPIYEFPTHLLPLDKHVVERRMSRNCVTICGESSRGLLRKAFERISGDKNLDSNSSLPHNVETASKIPPIPWNCETFSSTMSYYQIDDQINNDPIELLAAHTVSRRREFESSVQSLKVKIAEGRSGIVQANGQFSDPTMRSLNELNEKIKIWINKECFKGKVSRGEVDEDPERVLGAQNITDDSSHRLLVEDEESDVLNRLHVFSSTTHHILSRKRWYQHGSVRHGIQVALSVMLALILIITSPFIFPEPLVKLFGSNTAWTLITVIMIYEPLHGSLIKKSFHRILGTICGALIGLLVLLSVSFVPPFTCISCEYKLYLLVVSLVLISFGLSFFKIIYPAYAYCFVIALLTSGIVIEGILPKFGADSDGPSPLEETTYQKALSRVIMVTLGIVVSMVISSFVFPEKASTKFPLMFGDIFGKLSSFLLLVNRSYLTADFDPVNFRTEAYFYVDTLSKDLEQLRFLLEQTKPEQFTLIPSPSLFKFSIMKKERAVILHGTECLVLTKRMFYLIVSMVYARIFTQKRSSLSVHKELEEYLHPLFETFYNSMRAYSVLLMLSSIENKKEFFDMKLLRVLKDANSLSMYIFKEEHKRIYKSDLIMVAHGESEVTTWNHFALSFLQIMVNYDLVLESALNTIE